MRASDNREAACGCGVRTSLDGLREEAEQRGIVPQAGVREPAIVLPIVGRRRVVPAGAGADVEPAALDEIDNLRLAGDAERIRHEVSIAARLDPRH